MAEIPVERKEKSAFPWWLIPLLLLGLLLLLFLLYRGCDSRPAIVDNTNGNRANATINAGSNVNAANNTGAIGSGANANGSNTAVVVNNNSTGASVNTATNAGANNSGETVTAVNYFGTVQDKATIVGRNVDLRAAQVNRVLSDRVFTVKSENQEMYVMLDENLDSGGGKEQQIKIRPGQTLKLAGSFRTIPTAEVKDETQNRDLNKQEYARMKDQKVYLHATSVSDAR